jgi:SAM-dependent methyltransferase
MSANQPEPIFDPALAIARKVRALRAAAPGADFLMERAAEDLAERLDAVPRRFAAAATLFCLTPAAGEVLTSSGKADEILCVEADAALLAAREGRVAAFETVPFEPEGLDLAVSLYSLHEVNDVPGMLVQIRRALRPDGLFLGCMAGAGTLAELREALLAAETELTGGASPRVAPLVDVRDAGALLQRAGFALPVADHETVTVRYDSMFSLMRDLRAMGATSSLVAASRRGASCSCAQPKSIQRAFPIPTGACAPPSPPSGCRAGPRTPRSSSLPVAAAPPCRWPRRCARARADCALRDRESAYSLAAVASPILSAAFW